MKITEKVLDIYNEYTLCPHCLGRMFSLLATNTTNFERGNSILLTLTMQFHKDYLAKTENDIDSALFNLRLLAERAKYQPARIVLEKEGLSYSSQFDLEKCYLCQDIFFNLSEYVEIAIKALKDYEYDSLLVGTNLNADIINREDIFKAKYTLLESESFKTHFNREMGKILSEKLGKITDFNQPDITIVYSLSYISYSINLIIRSLFIYGKYNKFIRGIPQTHWDCRKCRGKGCESCNFTGKQYLTSVEELVSDKFKNVSKSNESKFHGAGREDIDVRMLGDGRPFILELKNPIYRDLNLKMLQKNVNKKYRKKVKINNLRYSNKKEVKQIKLKAENTKKVYRALVESSERRITKNEFIDFEKDLINIFANNKIFQRTPVRVSHRRSDIIREKKIYELKGTYLKSNLFEFTIETQGGTYIKELISGDEGRTKPSFSEIFGTLLICKELDVMHIDL